MILCIGPTPAAQRVMLFDKLECDTVNRATKTIDGAAGKAVNVAKVLKALGESPIVTGFIGGARGEEVRAELVALKIEMEFLTVTTRTRQCITVLDQLTGGVTELVQESGPVDAIEYDRLDEIIQRRISGCRAVVMSGSLTPGGPTDFYQRCAKWASKAGALSVVDAQGPPLIEALNGAPGLVKPNRSELAKTVGHELNTERELISAMHELHQRGAQRVVVTAGNAATLAFDGRNAWRIRTPRISVVNPIGSGDAFTAGLVWRLKRGEHLGEACRWAAAAGAANALTVMPGELEPGEVDRLAREVAVESL